MVAHAVRKDNERVVEDDIAILVRFLEEEGAQTVESLMEKLGWTKYKVTQTIEMGRYEGSIEGFPRDEQRANNFNMKMIRTWYYRYVDPSEYD